MLRGWSCSAVGQAESWGVQPGEGSGKTLEQHQYPKGPTRNWRGTFDRGLG